MITPNPTRMRMHYVGACSRIENEDDRDCIERALMDCVAMFPDSLELVSTSSGGFALEPIFTPRKAK